MKIRTFITTGVLTLAAWLVSVAPVAAQEFVKVENAAREELSAPNFVGAAYGFIWVAILAYVVMVANAKKFPQTNSAGASALADWMVSDQGQTFLLNYGTEQPGGIPLYYPIAEPEPELK